MNLIVSCKVDLKRCYIAFIVILLVLFSFVNYARCVRDVDAARVNTTGMFVETKATSVGMRAPIANGRLLWPKRQMRKRARRTTLRYNLYERYDASADVLYRILEPIQHSNQSVTNQISGDAASRAARALDDTSNLFIPRHARKRRRDYCPGHDVATRAYLARTVFEGKVRSMSAIRRAHYAVTFEVKFVYKNQSRFKPLLKNETIRLHFAAATTSTSACTCVTSLDTPVRRCHAGGGLVAAQIRPGKTYLLFVDRIGVHNFTVLGPPVIASNKSLRAVHKVLGNLNSVKPASVSELRDVTLGIGKRLKLVCRTQGFPPPRIVWYKNNQEIPLDVKRLHVRHRRRQSILTISRVKADDAGHYECRARGVIGPTVISSSFVRVTSIFSSKNVINVNDTRECKEEDANLFCLNGGTCMLIAQVYELACLCAEGFTGNRCELKVSNVAKTNEMMLLYSPTRLFPGF